MVHAISLLVQWLILSLGGASGGASGGATARNNIPPKPDFVTVCRVDPKSSTCSAAVLAAINHARTVEHLPPMVLPPGFSQDKPAEQLMVLANLERTARGLAPVTALDPKLSAAALQGATQNQDPALPKADQGQMPYRWSSNWAETFSPLAADYYWMYDDGWAGSASATFNVDVRGPNSPNAWDHRRNILVRTLPGQHMVMGAAMVGRPLPFNTYAEIFLSRPG